MIDFIEKRFPIDISYHMAGGPEYSTNVVETQGGYEQRNINWWQARSRYNVAHSIKTKAQLDSLISFFRICKGKAYGFRFKDWTDYKASNQHIGIGDGKNCNFQLVKNYTYNKIQETRIINKPVENTVLIFSDNVPYIEEIHIDYIHGMIEFSVPPHDGAIITADFEFDVPVRFDTDYFSATMDNYNSYSWQDINLIEIRI